MNTLQQLVHAPTRRVRACAALTVVAVVTVALWAMAMDGDSAQTAAMLGGAIATTAAAASATGRSSCRLGSWTRERRHAGR